MAKSSKSVVSSKSSKVAIADAVKVNPDAPLHVWSNLNGPLLFARGEHVVIRDDLDFPPTAVKYGFERKNAVNVYTLEIQDGTGKEYFAFEDSIRLATTAEIKAQEKWRDTEGAKQAARASKSKDRANRETADKAVDLVAHDPSKIGNPGAAFAKRIKTPEKAVEAPKSVKATKTPVKGKKVAKQAEKAVTVVTPKKQETKMTTVVKAGPKKARKTPVKVRKGKRAA